VTGGVARTAAFAVRVSSLVRRGQAHCDDEGSIRTKGRRNCDTALPYSAVDMIATEKTRTAKPAVRATCSCQNGKAGLAHGEGCRAWLPKLASAVWVSLGEPAPGRTRRIRNAAGFHPPKPASIARHHFDQPCRADGVGGFVPSSPVGIALPWKPH
jgi:hypothetical protein